MFDSSKRKNDEKAKGMPRRDRLLLLAAVLLVIGAVGFGIYRLTANVTDLTGRLFYTSDDVSYVINMATGERTKTDPAQRPRMAVHDWQPVSPDGKWSVEWVDGMGSTTGTGVYSTLRLTNRADLLTFDVVSPEMFEEGSKVMSWAPDSQSIIFIANPKGMPGYSGAEMWRLNMATKELTRLTNNTFAEMWPTVSPDGTKIGYVATADGYRRLYVMDVATGDVQLLTPEMFVYFPVWSPDGQWLAFKTDHSGSADIWIVRADGSESRPIAITAARDNDPVWIP